MPETNEAVGSRDQTLRLDDDNRYEGGGQIGWLVGEKLCGELVLFYLLSHTRFSHLNYKCVKAFY